MIESVDDLINELEKYRGKDVFISNGMFFWGIKQIDVEEEESNMIYLVIKQGKY